MADELATVILVLMLWRTVETNPLTPEQQERIRPYITRYAQTFGVTVSAVGGTESHLHILLELPPNRTLDELCRELRKTTVRFLRESQGNRGFNWTELIEAVSVSPGEREVAIAYVQNNADHHRNGSLIPNWEGMMEEDEPGSDEEELPEWLRNTSTT